MPLSCYAVVGSLLTLSCAYVPNWDPLKPDPVTARYAAEAMTEALGHWRLSTCVQLRMPLHEFGTLHNPRSTTMAVELEDTIVFFPKNIFAWEWVPVALHEMGHVWGLGHSSGDEPHLMRDAFSDISCVDEEAAAAYQKLTGIPARSTCVTTALDACEAPVPGVP